MIVLPFQSIVRNEKRMEKKREMNNEDLRVWVVGTTNRAKVECVAHVASKCFPLSTHIVVPIAVESAVAAQPMSAEESEQGAEFRARESIRLFEAAAAAATPNATEGEKGHGIFSKAIVVFSSDAAAIDSNKNKETKPPDDGSKAWYHSFGALSEQDHAIATHVLARHGSGKGLQIDFGVGLEGGLEKIGKRWMESGHMVCVEHATGRVGYGTSARFEMSQKLMKPILEDNMELAEVIDMLSGKTDVRSGAGAMGILTGGHLMRMEAYSHGLIFALAPFLSDPKTYW